MRHRSFALSLLALLALGAALAPAPTVHAQLGIARCFATYYQDHDGFRILGYPIATLQEVEGFPAQYFEKGRLECHAGEARDSAWGLMFGRVTADLLATASPNAPVSETSLTYGAMREVADANSRALPPAGFLGGVQEVYDPSIGWSVFIPVDPALRPARGYLVPWEFWSYMNRPELFPGGWLHDIGLPLTPVLPAQVIKGATVHNLTLQAFERTVLTRDPLNPSGWEIERGNIGIDALRYLPGTNVPAPIQEPELGENVIVPLHIDARVGAPNQQVIARLRWADGTELAQSFTLLRGEDGKGLLSANLEWVNMLAPPQPPTQSALLEVRDAAGNLLVRRGVTMLAPGDPGAHSVWLYWTVAGAERAERQARRVVIDPGVPRPDSWWARPDVERLAAITIEELLSGPPLTSQVGFTTAIPTPAEVLSHAGRTADWGHRVTLRSLTISGGLATADFSAAMQAAAGDGQRVERIREQISRTLLQFPEIYNVRITVNGQAW